MKKNKKGNLLKDMNISEVSLVGRGANEGAQVSLFKSDASIETLAKKSFNEVLSDMELAEELSRMIELFYEFSSALRGSLSSIIRDPSIAEKKTAIRESLNQFMAAMSGLIDGTDIIKGDLVLSPEETTQLIDFFGKNTEGVINYNNHIQGGFTMNELEKLQKKMDDLKKKADADAGKATADAAKAAAEVAKLKIVSKMNDEVKTLFNSLDEPAQADFLKKDEKEWAKEISKAKTEDDTFTAHGRVIRKSVVGEDVFEVMKAQQAEIETGRDIAKAEKAKREDAEFAKTAETEYKNLPGDPIAKGKVLRAIDGFDKVAKETLIAMLKAGNVAMSKSKVFDELGSNEVSEDSAEGQLNKLAKAEAADKDVSFAKAYTTILKTEAGRKLYEESLKK